ncbi:MAG TPA: hypothetical protein VL524_16560 [Gemmatimonadaceae bacterium]|nr:hypothetical protein [Gemmatimonadaceae bacterium]
MIDDVASAHVIALATSCVGESIGPRAAAAGAGAVTFAYGL